MDENFIEEFMNIGVDTFEDANAIFKLSSKYFLEIKKEEYKSEHSTLAEGLMNKMIAIGENFELNNVLLKELAQTSAGFAAVFSNPNQTLAQKLPHFNKAFSSSMKFYNAMLKEKPKYDIDFGPFKPSKSDKTNIVIKIMEAIDLINESDLINQKARDRIIDSLNKVISELNKPTTNWDLYFKRISHTILLLGAFTTIAKDTVGIAKIIETKEKLEEANSHLEKTSITVNYNDIKEVFIINEQVLLEQGKVLSLNKPEEN